MAIKVVGNDQQHVKQCSCGNCSARLEYTMADTREETVRDYTGDSDIVRRLVCPQCGHTITVGRY